MFQRRFWHAWGVVAGLALGLSDLLLFLTLGVEMTFAGRDIAFGVMGLFAATFAILGYVIGRLLQARAQAREDAAAIREQLVALEVSERAVRQNEKLSAIGRLAAGIAHEARNPLGVIRASASMLQAGFSAEDERFQACGFITEEIDRLDGVITSLLDFAKPTPLRVQSLDIEPVIDRAVELAAEETTSRRVMVTRDIWPGIPAVIGDPDLLTQVLLGLLVNASEAIDAGGDVVVRALPVGHSVQIEVADSGPGIATAEAERVFEPFFTTKPRGTGLGLPMAARIVHAHRGTLEVVHDSGAGPNGAGGCFRLSLPLAAQHQLDATA